MSVKRYFLTRLTKYLCNQGAEAAQLVLLGDFNANKQE